MALKKLEQQHSGFVGLRLSALVLGKGIDPAAEESPGIGLLQSELLADGTQVGVIDNTKTVVILSGDRRSLTLLNLLNLLNPFSFLRQSA